MTPQIEEEVNKKFKKVDITPTWPSDQKIRERRRTGRAGIQDEALKDVIPNEEEEIPGKNAWSKYYREITAKDIIKATAKTRRTTAAGQNGVTPWQYKKAIESNIRLLTPWQTLWQVLLTVLGEVILMKTLAHRGQRVDLFR